MKHNWSQEKYIDAFNFAAIAHKGQIYPSFGLPYSIHLSFVSMEIIAAIHHASGINGDLAIQCALLHDTLEDTKTKYEDLKKKFGISVADGVKALSKNPSLKKEIRLKDSLERIRKQPREIWMVKLADRIANMQKPPDSWDAERKMAYLKDAILIFNTLNGASSFLASRLKSKINGYN